MELRCWIDSSVARRGGKWLAVKGRDGTVEWCVVMCLFWCRIWNGSWKWIHLLWCWGYIELFLFAKEINKWNCYLWFFLKFCFFLALIFIMLVYYNDWIIFRIVSLVEQLYRLETVYIERTTWSRRRIEEIETWKVEENESYFVPCKWFVVV